MTTDGMGRWVYHGHNGDRGKVKRLKDNLPFAYDRESEQGRRRLKTCLFSAFGYGAVEESGGRNRTLSSSVRLTRTAAKKQRLRKETKQAGEASWLK